MRYCNECGSDIENSDVFCRKCGSKVKKTHGISRDEDIKADLKIEITNTTTEKAFKKVGKAVEGGKEVAKATTNIVKTILMPVVFLLVVGGIVATVYKNHKNKILDAEIEQLLQGVGKSFQEEERSCVIQNYKYNKSLLGNNVDANIIWGFVKTYCDLTYTDVEKYQKQLGMKLEKL